MILLVPGLNACAPSTPVQAVTDALYSRDTSLSAWDTSPVRTTKGILGLHRDGDTYECSMCHEGFEGELTQEALEGEHADINFDHGLNLLCLNCHHNKNADAFIYHDGSEIPGDEPTRLCAKCHGPHFREYSLGTHGRINGTWSEDFGVRKRLECIQCHDPHRPKFRPMTPEPPPVLTRFEKSIAWIDRGEKSSDEELNLNPGEN